VEATRKRAAERRKRLKATQVDDEEDTEVSVRRFLPYLFAG